MENVAIQEDATEDVGQDAAIPEDAVEETAPAKLPRDTVMDSIVKRRKEELGRDEPEEPEEQPAMVDLKVNGQVIQKPREEVEAEGGVAAIQKRIAAEQRLEQAAKERREIEEARAKQRQYEAELSRREQELTRKAAELANAAKTTGNVTDDDVAIAQEFVDGVYSGDEDQAKKAFAKVVQALRKNNTPPQQAAIDPNTIVAEAKKQWRYETDLEAGRQEFNEKYKHLSENPNLHYMTNMATARIQQHNPDWSPRKIILEAAREVDEWAKGIRGDSDALASQHDKKRQTIDNVQSAKARSPKEAGYKPKTPEEIFADMRKTRPR